jgi:hypothetical protein
VLQFVGVPENPLKIQRTVKFNFKPIWIPFHCQVEELRAIIIQFSPLKFTPRGKADFFVGINVGILQETYRMSR